MNGVWFAAMIAGLMVAGVAAQLGWQLPEMAEFKRVFRRERLRLGRPPSHQPTPVGVAEPR
jgi:hypothetical protein